jgi:hypothetical protein
MPDHRREREREEREQREAKQRKRDARKRHRTSAEVISIEAYRQTYEGNPCHGAGSGDQTAPRSGAVETVGPLLYEKTPVFPAFSLRSF